MSALQPLLYSTPGSVRMLTVCACHGRAALVPPEKCTLHVIMIVTANQAILIRRHPDKNKSPRANEKFIAVQEAYEMLQDEEKRREFDEYSSRSWWQVRCNSHYDCFSTVNEIRRTRNPTEPMLHPCRGGIQKAFTVNEHHTGERSVPLCAFACVVSLPGQE